MSGGGEENSTVELTDVESFHYLMRCLWDKEHLKKEHMVILDTILYKNGRPFRWMFTNNDGCVMKRRDENLNPREIIRVFKSRSKAMQSGKHHDMSGKIAIVWYVDDRNGIRSHFVDDVQLRSFLEEPVYECLAVQLYIGGFPLKGSGVFEHRFWMRRNGTTGYQTTELVSAAGADVTIYSEGVERLAISDYQHNALMATTKRIVKALERDMRGTVANIVLQVVFSKSWSPFVVGARSMLFWNPDSKITIYRAANLYVCEPPIPPSSGQRGSHLLPANHLDPDKHAHMGMPLTLPARVMKTPHKGEPGVDTTTGENLFDVIDDAPNTEYKQKLSKKHGELTEGDEEEKQDLDASLHKHLHEFGGEVELEHGMHVQVGEEALAARDSEIGKGEGAAVQQGHGHSHSHHKSIIAPSTDDSGIGPGGFVSMKKMNEAGIANPNMDKHPVTGTFLQKAVSKYNDNDLLFFDSKRVSTKMGNNDRFFNGEGMRPLGASDRGPHYPEGLVAKPTGEPGVLPGEDATTAHVSAAKLAASAPVYDPALDGSYDPLASRKGSTVTEGLRKQSIVMSRLAKPREDAAGDGTMKRLKTVLPGKGKGAIHRNHAYGQTESSKTRLEFYANQLKHVESLPLEKLLKHRRAISAPHGPRLGRANIPLDGPNAHLNNSMMASGKLSTKASVGAAAGAGVGVGRHGVDAGGRRSSGFERPVPLQSGTVCYGDFCFLSDAGLGGDDESAVVAGESTSAPATTDGDAQEGSLSNGGGLEKIPEASSHHRTDGGGGARVSKSSTDRQDATKQHEDKLNPHDLQPPILPYQLPFRSVLLLRSEENHLKCKLYEQWQFDDSIMESKAVLESREKEYKILDHNKRLLDLTQRHLRRVAYTCLHDVKRTVISLPVPHSTSSGFTQQWEQLSMSYRKLVYADALSKTHPSRFYQTVPMCETCQYIYSMADMFREEIVFGGVKRDSDAHSPHRPGSPSRTHSPGKLAEDLEGIRVRGRARREEADSTGSFKSREYGSPRKPGKTSMRMMAMQGKLADPLQPYDEAFFASLGSFDQSDDPDHYDLKFDRNVPAATEAEAVKSAIDQDAEIARLNALDQRYAAQLRDADEESIGPDGKQQQQEEEEEEPGRIGAWVKMLTEQVDAREEDRLNQGPGEGGGGLHKAKTDDRGKPNPMGPLAGQGVGNPLGQYRGLAAPTGYMLGQSAGDVGTRVIDEKGNFIYQKKRSPAERFGSSAPAPATAPATGGTGAGGLRDSRDAWGATSGAPQTPIGRGEDGIAFRARKSDRGGGRRPKSAAAAAATATAASTAAGAVRQRHTVSAADGFEESKRSGSGLVDIGQYQFKTFAASRLASTEPRAPRPKSAAASTGGKTSARVPTSLPSAHHAAAPPASSALDEYQFSSLPGGDAPLIPLSSMHRTNMQKSASTNELTMLPSYSPGGTSFEAMILDTHNAAEAYKKAQKLYSKRRPASGPATGRMSGRRREIHEEKERKRKEEEDIAARGYLGGLDMGAHTEGLRGLYSQKQEKLTLGKRHANASQE